MLDADFHRGRTRLTVAGRRLSFERRVITVEPGRARRYDAAEWRDALVVVRRGEIELEGAGGESCRFVRGDVLCLTGLPVRKLRNRGVEPTVLVAISRGTSARITRGSKKGDTPWPS